MKKQTSGIHHITAIVGHPQENVDFYAGVLGFRLVKKTVNFDDPGTYHLYFGNEGGKPGSIITFFPWPNAYNGKIGDGQVGVTTYVVPIGALDFWKNRLTKFNVDYAVLERFGETYLQFDDPHGLHLEIVERNDGELNPLEIGDIKKEVAIKGFGGAILYSSRPEETTNTLVEVLGLEVVGEEGGLKRFKATGDIGNIIDLKMITGTRGTMGVGTVHHIAWRAKDDVDHLEWQEYAMVHGQRVTEIKDRNYFNAIYFRESGEILFEIATDPPGFAHDETYETMGSQLMLPPQYEQYRNRLEMSLIPIKVRTLD
ncbi:ring-cleaving dioxygenase [Ureibacillus massiliensis 4400831 = CIP 108448 = CCUG 49529]|uniref:Ring-cleaving dioxygenase n=1 Tax=Ureibacillus massiliensis 4400831 = CIP 108448 = CCUG 49529 TaxID=1211035 RepID=A0A0A3IZS3_9BACL|nr:ring-cleaving dioxygenase [Ureibacillus massiliensis]KGR90211.1 ring-cleaving dioxygenase [Ureibacillus massiliensis 4400831 = CIP 108448 = CCUG 49529]